MCRWHFPYCVTFFTITFEKFWFASSISKWQTPFYSSVLLSPFTGCTLATIVCLLFVQTFTYSWKRNCLSQIFQFLLYFVCKLYILCLLFFMCWSYVFSIAHGYFCSISSLMIQYRSEHICWLLVILTLTTAAIGTAWSLLSNRKWQQPSVTATLSSLLHSPMRTLSEIQ